MTETEKKFTVPGPVPVDAKKLIDGLGTIFGGVIQLLAAMEPNMAKELADMAINGVPKENAPENFNPDDFEESSPLTICRGIQSPTMRLHLNQSRPRRRLHRKRNRNRPRLRPTISSVW